MYLTPKVAKKQYHQYFFIQKSLQKLCRKYKIEYMSQVHKLITAKIDDLSIVNHFIGVFHPSKQSSPINLTPLIEHNTCRNQVFVLHVVATTHCKNNIRSSNNNTINIAAGTTT